jgi:hypothetical protein
VRRDGGAPFCLPQPCASTLWLACPSRRLGRNGAGGCWFLRYTSFGPRRQPSEVNGFHGRCSSIGGAYD